MQRNPSFPRIPTGAIRVDLALGGGIPAAAITEISGPSGTGKTTLGLYAAAQAQRLGGSVAWIDADQSLEAGWAIRCGVDPENLYIAQPAGSEQALDTLETLARSRACSLIALDAIESLVTREELTLPLGASLATGDSRLSLALRRLNSLAQTSGTAILLLSRSEPGMGPIYHKLSTNMGRLSPRLHATLRLRLQPTVSIQRAGRKIGVRIQVQILKGGRASVDALPEEIAPFLQPPGFDIMYGYGLIKTGEIFDLGVRLRLIAWQNPGRYVYRAIILGAGRDECLAVLDARPLLSEEIAQAIRRVVLPNLYPVVDPVSFT